ncbi:MAG: phophatidylserine decarboxylase associated domain-containing protein [Lachnospiraceae bacterium]|nr:phophatidylserine decarboxylase associated domain-containing protein [Lachnospiraceae bacterium]
MIIFLNNFKWCEFLSSETSAYVLNDSENGWLCEAAKRRV